MAQFNQEGSMGQPHLYPGMRIVLEALEPSNGAQDTGVVMSQVVISGNELDATAPSGPAEALKPLLTYGPESVTA